MLQNGPKLKQIAEVIFLSGKYRYTMKGYIFELLLFSGKNTVFQQNIQHVSLRKQKAFEIGLLRSHKMNFDLGKIVKSRVSKVIILSINRLP